jgi:hypothetical protein
MIEMKFKAKAVCPIDGKKIKIAVEIRTDRLVKVEDILAAVAEITREPVLQEDFTKRLRAALRDSVLDVCTYGTHSGVRIACSA